MNPSLEQINEYRKSLGKPPLSSATPNVSNQATSSIADKYNIPEPPSLADKYGIPEPEKTLKQKLSERLSKFTEGIGEMEGSRMHVKTPVQGLEGALKVGGAVGGTIMDIGNAITEPIFNVANKIAEPINKRLDTLYGYEKPTNQIVEDVYKKGENQFKTLSPETQENVKNIGNIAGGAATLAGGKAILESAPGKLATKQLGKIKTNLTDSLRNYADTSIKSSIQKDVTDLLSLNKTLIKKTKEANIKNVNLNEQLSDPEVFKGLKPENSKINPDEAVNVIDNRIDKAMDIKSKTLPELDRFIPETPKSQLRDLAVQDIKGKYTPADEADIIARIDKQVAALPENLKISDIDKYRAIFRKSSRDAKGMLKDDSEYAALENAFRNKVFDTTDKLSFEGSKYKELNDYIRQNIETKDFLDKTLRGTTMKGGRLGNITARAIGAVAGASHGPIGAILGAEGGGMIQNIIMNNKLGNSLKMRMIREITDDSEIITQAEKLLQGVKDYQVPQLPAKGQGIQPTRDTIEVYPEAESGKFNPLENKTIITPSKGSFERIPTIPSKTLEKEAKDIIEENDFNSLKDSDLDFYQKEFEKLQGTSKTEIPQEVIDERLAEFNNLVNSRKQNKQLAKMGADQKQESIDAFGINNKKFGLADYYGKDAVLQNMVEEMASKEALGFNTADEAIDYIRDVIDLKKMARGNFGIKDIYKQRADLINSLKGNQDLMPNISRQNTANSTMAIVDNVNMSESIPNIQKVASPIVDKVSKELQPLYDEAKKYQSAEEFISSLSGNKKTLTTGKYGKSNLNPTEIGSWGAGDIVKGKSPLQPNVTIDELRLSNQQPDIFQEFKSSGVKGDIKNGYTLYRVVPEGGEITPGDFLFTNEKSAQKFMQEYGIKRGQTKLVKVDGVKLDEMLIPTTKPDSNYKYDEVIYAPRNTKSQLEQIWKEANKK